MVKKVLRTAVIEGSSLYLASQIAGGLVFEKNFQSLAITALALTVGTLIVKPIINILILPINLVTFNVFKWANHGIILFLVDATLSEFAITFFKYPGYSSEWIDIPPIMFDSGLAAYIAFSFLISAISGLLYWLVDKK